MNELRRARIGNDNSPACGTCGNACGPTAALCVRCTRLFALDAAREANALDLEISRERERERHADRKAM